MSPHGPGCRSRRCRASSTAASRVCRSATRRANAFGPWRRSSLIGVIARDVSDPFHIQVLHGVNEVSRSRDYRLFLGHVDYRPDVALTYGSMFERSHADGILILGDLAGGDEELADLTSQHRFVIGVSDRIKRLSFPGV